MDPEKTLFDEPDPPTPPEPSTDEWPAVADDAPKLHNGGLFAGNGQDISSLKG